MIASRRLLLLLPWWMYSAQVFTLAQEWQCHHYTHGQDTAWCDSVGTFEGYEYKLTRGDGTCGQCWCCKRPAEWQCHHYTHGQDTEWCDRIGAFEGYEYKLTRGDGTCGQCWCCKRPLSHPIAEVLCPSDTMPEEWLPRCLAGDLMYGRDLTGGDYPPEVGNGFVATVVRSDTIYTAGLFEDEATNKCDEGKKWPWCGPRTHRARIAPFHVKAAEEPSDAQKGGCALDVAKAVFYRRGLLADGAVQLDESWYAPYHEPSLLVHEIRLTNLGDTPREVTIVGQAAGQSWDLDMAPVAASKFVGVDFYAMEGTIKVPEIAGTPKHFVAMAANKPPTKVVVEPHGTYVVFALTAVATSLNSTQPTEDVIALLRQYTNNNDALASTLFEKHVAAWRKRTELGHLEVEGDLSLAQAVNASLYYIRSSIREDWPHGTSPGGLASNAYNGHTFWDQETWMFPPTVALEPGVARSMLQYRFDRIEQARKRAQECRPPPEGFMNMWPSFASHGTVEEAFWSQDPWHPRHGYCSESYTTSPHKPHALQFPWESADTGIETNQMDDRYGPWAMFEQHVTGDVAYAVWQYWQTTRDVEWLRSVGFPLVNGSASFFAARMVERTPKEGDRATDKIMYDIQTIMGPDEYTFPITNNAYTNAIARITLEFAAEAAEALGYTDDVYSKFTELAAGLFIPEADTVPERPDLEGGYHPEFEGFPKGRCQKGMCVKQADAIMLNFPLGIESDPKKLANDLDFYAEMTDPNGPAMTWSMFAINYFDHKQYSKSGDMFRRGYANMEPPFGVWTEFPITHEQQGAVNFITGAGGFLQSLVFGTSGMRITKEGLRFKPPPPSATGTSAVGFVMHSLHYLGSRLRQKVTEDDMTFELLEQAKGGPELCLLKGWDDEIRLLVGEAKQMNRSVAALIRACKGVSFEMKYSRMAAWGEATTALRPTLSLGLIVAFVFGVSASTCRAVLQGTRSGVLERWRSEEDMADLDMEPLTLSSREDLEG